MIEIVEFKSNGHPDTLTDLIVEACASALDGYYLGEYGRVLHYNVDKAIFLAGDVEVILVSKIGHPITDYEIYVGHGRD